MRGRALDDDIDHVLEMPRSKWPYHRSSDRVYVAGAPTARLEPTTKPQIRYRMSKTNVLNQWRAPTWSWASIHGLVLRRQEENSVSRALCTVLDSTVIPLGDDVMGELTSCELRIKGKLLSGRKQKGRWMIDFGLSSQLNSYPFDHQIIVSRDHMVFESRHHRAAGFELSALQLCQSGEGLYQDWLLLTYAGSESTYPRVGLMTVRLWKVHGQVIARLHESAAEEI